MARYGLERAAYELRRMAAHRYDEFRSALRGELDDAARRLIHAAPGDFIEQQAYARALDMLIGRLDPTHIERVALGEPNPTSNVL